MKTARDKLVRREREQKFRVENGFSISSAWKWQHPENVKRYNDQITLRRQANPEVRQRANEAVRRYKKKLKYEVFVAYSTKSYPVCECCNETIEAFLTLDHVNNDGAAHKKRLTASSSLYQTLKNTGFPQTPKLRVLCYNCNCGRRINNGICPHQEGK